MTFFHAVSRNIKRSKTSLSIELSSDEVKALLELLRSRNFESKSIDYTQFAYSGENVQVSVYEKKNRLVVQGKGMDDFIEFSLEPYVTGVLEHTLVAHTESAANSSMATSEEQTPHFGVDESGKGDYFGPLVIAGVYVNAEIAKKLRSLGICDSKLVSTSSKIRSLAKQIRAVHGIQYQIVSVGPERYNELYYKMNNLNRFLAWGHSRVIEELIKLVPDCPRALSDQFANPKVLQQALAVKNIHIQLDQRTKAESDVAVAAASILARERFVNWMDQASEAGGITLPLGASNRVISAAKEIIAKHGEEMLPKVAKMHFKTTQTVLGRKKKD